MRQFYFFSLIAILFSFNSFGQISYDSIFFSEILSRTNCFYKPPVVEKRDTTKIRIGCGVVISNRPLYIIDGKIEKEVDVKNIDPNDIEAITILKGTEATALFGSRGISGVIIITTKKSNQRTIRIRDAVSGEPLPAATVDFIYGKRKQHTIRLLADSLGQVSINKIRPGIKYELRVSNIGYETFTAFMNASLKTYIIDEIKTMRNTSIDKLNAQGVQRELKFYPNPVLRSQQVNIEFENAKQGKITLKLFSLDGRSVGTKEYEAIKGMNNISYSINAQLAAGTYFIQLIDENDKLIKTEKLIIQ